MSTAGDGGCERGGVWRLLDRRLGIRRILGYNAEIIVSRYYWDVAKVNAAKLKDPC
jgi:hypothetical protein